MRRFKFVQVHKVTAAIKAMIDLLFSILPESAQKY